MPIFQEVVYLLKGYLKDSWMENHYDSASQQVRDKVVAFVEGPVTEEFPQLASGLLKSAQKPKVIKFSMKVENPSVLHLWTVCYYLQSLLQNLSYQKIYRRNSLCLILSR